MAYDTPRPAGTSAPGMLWTRWVTLIAGILLFLASFVLGYMSNTTAFWTTLVLGALIAIFAFIGLMSRTSSDWSQWVVGILGVLAFIAPWVLSFAGVSSAFWSCIVLGAITVIVAAIGLFVRPAAAA